MRKWVAAAISIALIVRMADFGLSDAKIIDTPTPAPRAQITHHAMDGFGSQLYAAFSCMLWSRVSNGTVAYIAPSDSAARGFDGRQHKPCRACTRVYAAVHAGWPRAADAPQMPKVDYRRECYHDVLHECTASPEWCARAAAALASQWRGAVVALPEYHSTPPIDIAFHFREGDRTSAHGWFSVNRLIKRFRSHLRQTGTMDALMLAQSNLDFGALHRELTGGSPLRREWLTHLFVEHAGEGGALLRQVDRRRVVVHSGGNAMRAWMQMVRSRVLISDESTFSASASLVSDGLIVHRFPRFGPGTHWDLGVPYFHCPLLNATWWWSAAPPALQPPAPSQGRADQHLARRSPSSSSMSSTTTCPADALQGQLRAVQDRLAVPDAVPAAAAAPAREPSHAERSEYHFNLARQQAVGSAPGSAPDD